MTDDYGCRPFESKTPMQKRELIGLPDTMTYIEIIEQYADNVSYTREPELLHSIMARVKPVYVGYDLTGAVCVPHGENGETVLYITYERLKLVWGLSPHYENDAVWFKAKTVNDRTPYTNKN